MKKIILIVVFVLLSNPALGAWSEEKTARELCFLYVLTNDYKQTIDITKKSNHRENNKILGKYPSRDEVNTYFISCAVGHALIAYFLPDDYSKIWQLAWIGIQSKQVDENNDSGLGQNMDMAYRLNYTIKF